jgi:hypothetical protein
VPETLTRTGAPATRVVDLDELELLWSAPAAEPSAPRSIARAAARVALGGHALAGAWIAVLAVALAGTPAAEEVTPPIWTDVVLFGFLLALAGAGAAGRHAPRVGFAASAVAGALGTVLGVACRATEHHTGGWWVYETAAFGALAALSLAGLARRLKPST